jgi:uncharacterized protein (DUF1697 family)
VKTYIQSGNIIFNHDSNCHIENKIHDLIEKKFGYDVPVLVRSLEELTKISTSNPFFSGQHESVEKIEEKYLHVTFLAEEPESERLENIMNGDYGQDQFISIGKDIYLFTPGGYGKTKLSNNFFESKLKVKATTRNWKTVNALTELSKTKEP